MQDSRGSALRTGLLGLVVGAGVCYCVYRVTFKRKKKDEALVGTNGETIQKEHEASLPAAPVSSLLQKVSRISVISSTAQSDSKSPKRGMDVPKSAHDLEAHHIQELINLLEFSEDPSVQEQVLVTLSNSAAFSVNQDIIRNLGGLTVVGKMLSVPVTKVKEKALNALNNLSMNVTNQEELKIYINKVCEEINFSDLNSELQLAGLRFLTNMSVTNNCHYMMTSSIPCFLRLLLEGNERTQVQVLKVLVNLSANPSMAEHLLNAQAPFLLSLLDSCINKDVLLRVLMFATNLTQNIQKSTTKHHQYREDSLFSVLCKNSTLRTQKLASLLHHHDMQIKEQVAELLVQLS